MGGMGGCPAGRDGGAHDLRRLTIFLECDQLRERVRTELVESAHVLVRGRVRAAGVAVGGPGWCESLRRLRRRPAPRTRVGPWWAAIRSVQRHCPLGDNRPRPHDHCPRNADNCSRGAWSARSGRPRHPDGCHPPRPSRSGDSLSAGFATAERAAHICRSRALSEYAERARTWAQIICARTSSRRAVVKAPDQAHLAHVAGPAFQCRSTVIRHHPSGGRHRVQQARSVRFAGCSRGGRDHRIWRHGLVPREVRIAGSSAGIPGADFDCVVVGGSEDSTIDLMRSGYRLSGGRRSAGALAARGVVRRLHCSHVVAKPDVVVLDGH
jgi:hypothetical protein